MNGPDGTEYEQRNRVTLCRCGASANKPYCDGTHVTVHFQDHLPLSTESEEKMKYFVMRKERPVKGENIGEKKY